MLLSMKFNIWMRRSSLRLDPLEMKLCIYQPSQSGRGRQSQTKNFTHLWVFEEIQLISCFFPQIFTKREEFALLPGPGGQTIPLETEAGALEILEVSNQMISSPIFTQGHHVNESAENCGQKT